MNYWLVHVHVGQWMWNDNTCMIGKKVLPSKTQYCPVKPSKTRVFPVFPTGLGNTLKTRVFANPAWARLDMGGLNMQLVIYRRKNLLTYIWQFSDLVWVYISTNNYIYQSSIDVSMVKLCHCNLYFTVQWFCLD